MISNEPSVRGEIEPKETEKKTAYESNVSSFAQKKPVSNNAPPSDFNEEKVGNHVILQILNVTIRFQAFKNQKMKLKIQPLNTLRNKSLP